VNIDAFVVENLKRRIEIDTFCVCFLVSRDLWIVRPAWLFTSLAGWFHEKRCRLSSCLERMP